MRYLAFFLVFALVLLVLPGEAYGMSTGELRLGDYVQFGSYYDAPILWRVINVNADGSRMLFSERVLALKGFDPRGNAPGGRANQHRLDYGSNYYPESTLRIWLNSEHDQVSYPYNPPTGHPVGFFYPQGYDELPGFLTNFTVQERDAIAPHTHRVLIGNLDIPVRDGGTEAYVYNTRQSALVSNSARAYYKQVTDRVFLLGAPELQRFIHDRGWYIMRKPTPQLVQRVPWMESEGFSVNANHPYWLNTAFPPSGSHSFVLTVGDGTRTYHGGNIGSYFPLDNQKGLVPALNLKPGINVASGAGTISNPYVVFQNIPVYLDGVQLSLSDPPILKDGRTLVPMRAFFEALGAEVSWEGDTRTAVGQRGETTVRIPIDSMFPTINGEEYEIDVPAQIIGGRTYIPLRFTGEALGDRVQWDAATRSIHITRRLNIVK